MDTYGLFINSSKIYMEFDNKKPTSATYISLTTTTPRPNHLPTSTQPTPTIPHPPAPTNPLPLSPSPPLPLLPPAHLDFSWTFSALNALCIYIYIYIYIYTDTKISN